MAPRLPLRPLSDGHSCLSVHHAQRARLQRPDDVLARGPRYLVDVMLLADDGEGEEGTGICGVVLRDEELRKDTQRLSRAGSEAPRQGGAGEGGRGEASSAILRGLREVRATSVQETD